MVLISEKTTTKLPPSTHEFAEVIHRLEAGGSMLPDTPENLMQIIGIYKAYAVPMDFYWRDLLYIGERIFLQPFSFFKYFLPQEYLDLRNHYAGDDADIRIWRGLLQPIQSFWLLWKKGGRLKCQYCCITYSTTGLTWNLQKLVCKLCYGIDICMLQSTNSMLIWIRKNIKLMLIEQCCLLQKESHHVRFI